MKPHITIPRLNFEKLNHHQQHLPPSNSSSPTPSPTPSATSSPSHSTASRKSPLLRNVNFPFIKGRLIGRGTFGDVFFAMNANSGECMAIKQISRIQGNNEAALKTFQREVKIVSNLRHPHVVGYLGISVSPNNFSIFMEYCSGGSLASMLSQFGCLPETVVQNLSRQLLLGLAFLHHCGVAHRDIKGANVLVVEDTSKEKDPLTVKLADFGCARDVCKSSSDQKEVSRGTPAWMPPEVIRNELTSDDGWMRADIWSLGCTCIEMATGAMPWEGMKFSNPHALMIHIANPKSELVFPRELSASGHDFLASCINRRPDQRLTPQQILQHPFVAKPHSVPKREQRPPMTPTKTSAPPSPTISAAPTPPNNSTPPIDNRKKSSFMSGLTSKSSQSSFSSSSQWTSSRRTPPVSPSLPRVDSGGSGLAPLINKNKLGPYAAMPSPPMSLLNALSARSTTSSVSSTSSPQNAKQMELDEERRRARKERRKKKSSKKKARTGSFDGTTSPSLSLPENSPRLSSSDDDRLTQSTPSTSSFGDKFRRNVSEGSSRQEEEVVAATELNSKQKAFMAKLGGGGGKKAEQVDGKDDDLTFGVLESPRVRSFRRKFPSMATGAFEAEEEALSPISLESKLKELDVDDRKDTMTSVYAAVNEFNNKKEVEEAAVVDEQTANIARLWLAAAREVISCNEAAYNEYNYDEYYNYEADDVYDVDYAWAEGEEVIEVDVGGEEVEEENDANDDDALPPKIVRAVATFNATDATELGFAENSFIAVTDEDASGWWYGVLIDGEAENAAGWFPSNHVQEVEKEEVNHT